MMKAMRKTRVNMVMAAAVAGMAVSAIPQQAAAQTVASGFSPTGTGQVLIFPYYTVNDGWRTLLNVTNTNTAMALAVKVRFHEAQNSRDVLDFNVLMSPGDAWTGWVELAPDQDPASPTFGDVVTIFKTQDATCTSPLSADGTPLSGIALREIAYTGAFDDGGSKEASRLSEGYVEMIVMGQCDMTKTTGCAAAPTATTPAGIGWMTEHVSGVPRDCETADDYFVARDPAFDLTLNVAPGNGDPIAANEAEGGYEPEITVTQPLKGNVSYVNIANGIGAGSEAMHLDNVMASGVSFVTAQNFPWFLEPTIATVPAGLWDPRQIDAVESRMNWSSVVNEWSSNPLNGVLTDWVVNFPTKGYHVDVFCNQMQANNNRWRQDGTTAVACDATTPSNYDAGVTPAVSIAPFETRWQDTNGDGIAESPIRVRYVIFDREEGSVTEETGGTTPSPAPPAVIEIDTLPFETNVLSIGGDGAVESALSSEIASQLDAVDLLDSASAFGWLSTDFVGSTTGALPVVGFAMKTRDFGDATLNFGQMMQHAYRPAP